MNTIQQDEAGLKRFEPEAYQPLDENNIKIKNKSGKRTLDLIIVLLLYCYDDRLIFFCI
jgi:hypothetical protein